METDPRYFDFWASPAEGDKVRLTWCEKGTDPDALDYWVIPQDQVEDAKRRVRAGEFD